MSRLLWFHGGLPAAILCVAVLGLPTNGFAQPIAQIDTNDVRGLYNPEGFSPFRPGTTPPADLPANVDVNAVRQGLTTAARDAQALYDSLIAQDRRISGLRQYTGSLLRLQVRADQLSRSINNRAALEQSLPELRQIDTEWRQLSYQLKQFRGLDRTSTNLIAQLDRTSEQITKTLQIGPGVDYRELVIHTNSLATAVDRLIQDIDYSYGRTNEGRQLVTSGQTIKQQAMHIANGAFQQFDHDHLVADFQVFQRSWSAYLDSLRKFRDPLIDRDVQQVSEFERLVLASLRMEQRLDRSQLAYLASQLTSDVDEFFSKAPLKMLMRLPEANRALSTADAFYGNFENFVDVVNRGENRESLQDTFVYINDAWEDFVRVYRPLQSAEAQQVLSMIEKNMIVLRDSLLIQEDFDRRQAMDLASQVSALAMFIERDTNNWLRKARLPNASQIQRDVARYRQNAEELHAAISGGANLREIRQLCEKTFEDWRRVYDHIINCRESERASLASSSSQTTPALIQLRSVFGQ